MRHAAQMIRGQLDGAPLRGRAGKSSRKGGKSVRAITVTLSGKNNLV
jgi:hypothetical protein